MSRYEVVSDQDRLTLVTPVERRMLLAGCPLFFFASLSLVALGLLCVLYDANHPSGRAAGDPMGLFNPRSNQFGFLWLVAALFIATFIPLYVYLVHRLSRVICFDRIKGAVLRHGRPITWLGRIEYLRIQRARDADSFATYTLVMIYGDGYEVELDESQDESEMRALGSKIAEFTGVRLLAPAKTGVR